MLKLNQINTSYGLNHVLRDICIDVEMGEIVSLLGRNGAGKTTVIQTIAGLLHPRSGQIFLEQTLISGLDSFEICRHGIGWVPQGRRLFPEISVNDNIQLAFMKLDKSKREKGLNKVYELFPILKQRKNILAFNLSGGEQQMLAIARALIGEPKVILMDEPSEGLSLSMVTELSGIIRQISSEGVAVLLAEQNIKVALSIASRHYILDKGEVCYSASTNELTKRPDVLLNFLGVTTKKILPVS